MIENEEKRTPYNNIIDAVEVYYPYTIDSGIRYNSGRTCSVLMIDVTRRQICRAKPKTDGNQVSLRSNRLDNTLCRGFTLVPPPIV